MPKKNIHPEIELALKRAGVVVDEIERLSQKRNKFYTEHDELAVRLKKVPSKTWLEHELVFEDSFEKNNTQWGHGPVRQFKISRPKAPKKPRKGAE